MTRFEIRRADGVAIREDAVDELDAIEQAVAQGHLAEGDGGSVEPADQLPVGWYGDDPEAG